MDEKKIHMGTLTRPHGIKGEICVDWYADSPELLSGLFYLQAGREEPRKVTGAKVRMHKGRPLLTLPFVKDRNDVEALRGLRVLVDRDSLPPLSEDEAYMHDLLGLTVVDHDSGAVIGTLVEVEFPSEQDIWVIESAEGEEILLPAVPEFVVAFDLKAGEVRVSPPLGLIELYTSSEDKE